MQNEARIMALDIETFADVPMDLYAELTAGCKGRTGTNDPVKIEAQIKAKQDAIMDKAALSPLTGRVVSWAVYSEKIKRVVVDDGGGEEALLLELDSQLAKSGCTYIATKHGRMFDIPFLAARYAIHGIAPVYPLPLKKYDPNHIDIEDVFPEKLGLWAMRFGLPAKLGGGGDVAALVEAEKWEELGEYNLRDAEITWELAMRLLPILKG